MEVELYYRIIVAVSGLLWGVVTVFLLNTGMLPGRYGTRYNRDTHPVLFRITVTLAMLLALGLLIIALDNSFWQTPDVSDPLDLVGE